MGNVWDILNNYSGSILLGLFAAGLIAVLGIVLTRLISSLGAVQESPGFLPMLAIGGVISLILVLTIVATIFSILGITNKTQAMGLPEGSIRAVIALSLIVLFAILSVFLYRGVSEGGPLYTIQHLSDDERAKFLSDRPTIRDVQAVVVVDAKKEPIKNASGKLLYDISYRGPPNPVGDDFAKQLLVLLGTLMTAITSFYLGAGTAQSAASTSQAAASSHPAPTVSVVSPTVHSIATGGAVIHLQVTGTNLNIITRVKIARAGVEVAARNVASNPTSVTCDVDVSTTTTPPGGAAWDVVVEDGASISVRLPGALTINA